MKSISKTYSLILGVKMTNSAPNVTCETLIKLGINEHNT